MFTFLNYSYNQLIYDIKQKCKQTWNLYKLLCNSRYITKINVNFYFFEKNVNKQLKSADFFTETSKFWKIILRKILSFFIVMSKHTFIFIVHPPNVKYLIFLISIFCYLCLNWNGKSVFEKFNLFYTPDVHTVLHQLDSSYNPTANFLNWTCLQTQEKSENFFYVTD